MAYVIAVILRNQGIHLDPILAYRGGLLHDLDKLHTVESSHPMGMWVQISCRRRDILIQPMWCGST